MESRLVDLELRYMQLERQLSELNTVVYDQHKMIDCMRRELVVLRNRVQVLGESLKGEAPVPLELDKPPHY